MRISIKEVIGELKEKTHAKFPLHKPINEPVSKEQHICLRSYILRESEQEASGLREARGVEADAFLQFHRERGVESCGLVVELGGGCEGIGEVGHFGYGCGKEL